MDSTTPLLPSFKISSFRLSFVGAQTGLCWTRSETQIVGLLTHRLVLNINCVTAIAQLVSAFGSENAITKTCPYNVHPLESHLYIVKMGFAGVCLFFLILLQIRHLVTRLNRLEEALLMCTHDVCFEQK